MVEVKEVVVLADDGVVGFPNQDYNQVYNRDWEQEFQPVFKGAEQGPENQDDLGDQVVEEVDQNVKRMKVGPIGAVVVILQLLHLRLGPILPLLFAHAVLNEAFVRSGYFRAVNRNRREKKHEVRNEWGCFNWTKFLSLE